jgi:hydroxyethylthiazole kinase-like uncharacterized protein yjeF
MFLGFRQELVMKYVTVAEMIAIEKESDSVGHTYPQMMEYAGKGLAETVHHAYNFLKDKRVLGLVGSGNNGGDTLVALAHLQEWGWNTTAYILRSRHERDPLVKRARRAGSEILEISSDSDYKRLLASLKTHTILLDGVLGTGIHLPLRGTLGDVLALIKAELGNMESPPHVVAVDCPSGVDCDTGENAPESIPAEITVTMAAIKQGMLKFPAFNLVGKLCTVGIGLPEGLDAFNTVHREVIDDHWVRSVMPRRPLDSHKGTFGVVMILAGSVPYSGAVLLAGEAAFRSGAGWVTLAVPEPLYAPLAGSFIEATWLPLPHEGGWISAAASGLLLENLEKVTAMLIGPGFGMAKTTGTFLRNVLDAAPRKLPPMIVDADGLKLMADIPGWVARLPALTILTPHPGEMAVITGLPLSEIQSDRVGVAERYAGTWGHVVVLKGAFTVIASPNGRTFINPVATPALARAGTGDVLAGVVTGLRAQGMDAFEAAVAGVWLHAQAGLRAAEILGSTASVLAGDVLAAIVDVIADL